MRRFWWNAFIVICSVLGAGAAHAEKRVALVIGNSTYQHTPKLANPKNDATDMTATLHKLGFQVIDGFDLDKVAFDKKVREFATALQGAEAGLFFFAGHGLQVAGKNYLIPIDAELKTASALAFETVQADVVQGVMEHETNTNILVLDACRDNPLARNLARALGTRSVEVGRGFAPVVSGGGTLISFSTQPGNVALDGTGRNSPFAAALVKRVAASKDDLSAILIDVRNDVMRETHNKQVPWEHSALRGRFYFSLVAPTVGSAADATNSSVAAQLKLSEAAQAWDRTKDTTSIPGLEAFLRRFGDTYYGDLAKPRLADLKQAEASKQAAEAAKRKTDEEAHAKAEAEPKKQRTHLDDCYQILDLDRQIRGCIAANNLVLAGSAYLQRGHAYNKKGDSDLAIADLTKAIEMAPNEAVAYYERGVAYTRKGQYDRAIADHTNAIKMVPRYAVAYYERGVAYAWKGDNNRAIADYRRALAIDPNDQLSKDALKGRGASP